MHRESVSVQQVKALCHLAIALTMEVEGADLPLSFVALIHHHVGLRKPTCWMFASGKETYCLQWAASLIETHQSGTFDARSL